MASKSEWFSGDIVIIREFLTKQTCLSVLDSALKVKSIKPEESNGGTPFEIVNDFSAVLPLGECLDSIHLAVVDLFPSYEIQDTFYLQNSLLKMQHPGQSHNIHTDANTDARVKSVGRTTIDDDAKLPSLISTIVVLNDDYEGGNFVFPEYGVSTRLNAGDLIAWPSAGHLHGVEVVLGTKTRYSLVSWWYQKGAVSSVVRAGDS